MPLEIQTEAVRDEISEEIAAAVLPLARVTPFTYRALLTQGRVAEILRRDGHGDMLDELQRQLQKIDRLETAAKQRLEARKIELMEEGRLQRFVDEREAELRDAYESPAAAVDPWPVSQDVWRKAFVALAIKHREPGFIIDDIGGSRTNLTKDAKVIGDDPERYGNYMLQLLRALGGGEFEPAARLPDGHNDLAAKAATEILDEERKTGICVRPDRAAPALVR